jgi:hypothetical protein
MKRLATTIAALAALALPSLAQAQSPPPPPPGEPPTSGPPPGLKPPAPEFPAAPAAAPTTAPQATVAPPTDQAPAAAPARQPLKPAGKVTSIRLNGRMLVVKVACTPDARAKLQLTSGKVSIGQRRYHCNGTRMLKLRAPRAVVRRAHRRDGVDVRARISATGFESNFGRVRVRTLAVARASTATRASANQIPCSWCIEYVFGGFGNMQTLEYWVRTSELVAPQEPVGWFKSGGWWYWWGDAQYYQNYASAYITTYRYWYYWNGSQKVYYTRQDIGP